LRKPSASPPELAPLVRFAAPYRVLSLETLAPALVRCSPHVLRLTRRGLQGFHAPGPRETKLCFPGSSLGLQLLFRGQSTEPLHKTLALPRPGIRSSRIPSCSASHEVSDPCSAFPTQSSGLKWLWFTKPEPPAPPGVRNLLALSSALSLPALFHAGSAHGVNPSELCSSRVAVRRFRRLDPLGVPTAFRALLRARVRHLAKRFRLWPSA